ncbi:MAG TPA: tetratricopeptide repeat protein [Gemmatimonadaceae bacterium]|nr:tetratricopeptide repeat protein [Gemmatimonadaceae bacterium]
MPGALESLIATSLQRGDSMRQTSSTDVRASLLLAAVALLGSQTVFGQQACRSLPAARGAIDRGWTAYRANDITTAEREFRQALTLCPNEPGALTGAGYVAMRQTRLIDARSFFARAITRDSASYDAVAGAGMAAYRAGDTKAARTAFERLLRIAPNDSTARDYLTRLGVISTDVALSSRARPTTMTMPARTGRKIFEVRVTSGQWQPTWIKAVNLGAALPGKFPAEFPPDDSTYEKWIALIAEMGANTVRLYTIHPPHFYAALRKWNLSHPDHPLWLIHGVWTEPPPGKEEDKYDDAQWLAQFQREMKHVVAVVHGDATIPALPGHASGSYTADVSQWTIGYIVGREWEPYSVIGYNKLHPAKTSYIGKYMTISGGNPLEVWLAQQCDFLVSFEMDRYNAQRPIAYSNWPTLDPLTHPTETGKAQEIALLKARGEKIVEMPIEYDNDTVGLDAVKMRGTPAFGAGIFASYHAYPYYPEFMVVDPGYRNARSPEGPSNYFGYLRELVSHYGNMPVVISEYGVPSSRGSAHVQPQGWNHGGLSEADQAQIDARLTRDIYASGAAGAGLFALIDEWFKKNWVVVEFEQPLDRKRMWLNALDAEENYGVIAMRAGAKGASPVIDGDSADWRGRPLLYSAPGSTDDPLRLKSFRVAYDEAYVYLRLDVGKIDWSRAHYQIGVDTYRRELGDTRLPNTGSKSPVGLEFVIDIGGPNATQVLVDHPYNLYKPVAIPGSKPTAIQYVNNVPFKTVANNAGQWDSLFVVTNRRRVSRDGKIFPSIGYNRNRLLYAKQSETTLADWYTNDAAGVIEMRIPWGMLQVTDPSSHSVLFGTSGPKNPASTMTDGFRFIVESYDRANPTKASDRLPRGAGAAMFGTPTSWTWPNWEVPQWHSEIKPLFGAMQHAFAQIPEHPARQ